MTKEDKILFIRFVCRTRMYITGADMHNIISFITGYEIGSTTCNFTRLFETFISEKYGTHPNNAVWIGHVGQISQRESIPWPRAFKKLTLEFIASQEIEDLLPELNQSLKPSILTLLKLVEKKGNVWFNLDWIEDWNSFVAIRSPWFENLWTKEEFEALKAIDSTIQNNLIFSDEDNKIPTQQLLEAKLLFQKASPTE